MLLSPICTPITWLRYRDVAQVYCIGTHIRSLSNFTVSKEDGKWDLHSAEAQEAYFESLTNDYMLSLQVRAGVRLVLSVYVPAAAIVQ
jgi:hypothetical protein